jgi:hypothetical protein
MGGGGNIRETIDGVACGSNSITQASTVTINISIDAITLLPNNFVAMTALTATLVSSYMQNRIRWEIAHEVEGAAQPA